MTTMTSRIVRGTRGRILLYVCAILIVTGIIACYNNTRLQLDDLVKSNELCRQQQEHLTSQLQVIFDYKQRLEKSLKSEKVENERTKNDLEGKLRQEKEEKERAANDDRIRFTSLRQQYQLLERHLDDFREESGKIQRQQLTEIKTLQQALKQLTQEKYNLEEQLKNANDEKNVVKKETENLRKKLRNIDIINPTITTDTSTWQRVDFNNVNFSQQLRKKDDKEMYEIAINQNANEDMARNNVTNYHNIRVQQNGNEIHQNLGHLSSTTSTTSTTKITNNLRPAAGSILNPNGGGNALNAARPLVLPTAAKVTPETLKKLPNSTTPATIRFSDKIAAPKLFVPKNEREIVDNGKGRYGDIAGDAGDANESLPGRYGNKKEDEEREAEARFASKTAQFGVAGNSNEIDFNNNKNANEAQEELGYKHRGAHGAPGEGENKNKNGVAILSNKLQSGGVNNFQLLSNNEGGGDGLADKVAGIKKLRKGGGVGGHIDDLAAVAGMNDHEMEEAEEIEEEEAADGRGLRGDDFEKNDDGEGGDDGGADEEDDPDEYQGAAGNHGNINNNRKEPPAVRN